MNGQRLHAFDLRMCRYILDNIWEHMDAPAFAAFVEEQLEPPVLEYLTALGESDAPPPSKLLLNDDELDALEMTFAGGPLQFDRAWNIYKSLHRRSIECVKEIRDSLALEYAEEWARLSEQFTARLEARGVWLHHGIEIVHQWLQEARRLLGAMGATTLLPYPEGAFPTPHCPEPPSMGPQQVVVPETAERQVAPEQMQDSSTLLSSVPNLAAILERLAVALEGHGTAVGSPAQPVPEALSKEDAAKFIGVDVATIEYLIRTRKLAYVQYGSQRGRLIPVEGLRNFLRDHRQATADELLGKRRKG